MSTVCTISVCSCKNTSTQPAKWRIYYSEQDAIDGYALLRNNKNEIVKGTRVVNCFKRETKGSEKYVGIASKLISVYHFKPTGNGNYLIMNGLQYKNSETAQKFDALRELTNTSNDLDKVYYIIEGNIIIPLDGSNGNRLRPDTYIKIKN